MQPFEEVILQGIEGLPREALVEIATFIYFVRKRVLNDQFADDKLYAALIRAELIQLSRDEVAHLEQELDEMKRL